MLLGACTGTQQQDQLLMIDSLAAEISKQQDQLAALQLRLQETAHYNTHPEFTLQTLYLIGLNKQQAYEYVDLYYPAPYIKQGKYDDGRDYIHMSPYGHTGHVIFAAVFDSHGICAEHTLVVSEADYNAFHWRLRRYGYRFNEDLEAYIKPGQEEVWTMNVYGMTYVIGCERAPQ